MILSYVIKIKIHKIDINEQKQNQQQHQYTIPWAQHWNLSYHLAAQLSKLLSIKVWQ
mgnify:CR=1 FL=1